MFTAIVRYILSLFSRNLPMTGPSVPSNDELIAKAHEQELEGGEWASLATDIETFIAAKQAQFDEAMAAAQAQIDALSATQLPDDARNEISTALENATASFNTTQDALRAIITPPDVPIESRQKSTGKRSKK